MGKRPLFAPVRERRGEILAAVRRARRSGSPEAVGETLAIALVTMTPDAIIEMMGKLPGKDGVGLVDAVDAADRSLQARAAVVRCALARLAVLAQQSGGANG